MPYPLLTWIQKERKADQPEPETDNENLQTRCTTRDWTFSLTSTKEKAPTEEASTTTAREKRFRAEKRSAQASAHPLSQAHGGLFFVLTSRVDCVCLWNARGERLLLVEVCKAFLLVFLSLFLLLLLLFFFVSWKLLRIQNNQC